MIKEIEKDLNKLSERCDEIDVLKQNIEVRDIVLDLKDTLRTYENGVGLAAPQIGYNKRIFVMKFANNEYRSFINPIIVDAKGFELSREGCLSFPDKEFIRPRNNQITAIYQTPLGKTETRKFVGFAAKIFQHELDHLDGLTLPDVALELPENYDKLTDDEKEDMIRKYLDSLDVKQKEIDKEIQENENLKKVNDGIEFMQKLAKGEVQLESRPFTEDEQKQLKKKQEEFKKNEEE